MTSQQPDQPGTRLNRKKSSAFYCLLLTLWTGSVALLSQAWLEAARHARGTVDVIFLLFCGLSSAVFSFYGIWHLLIVISSSVRKSSDCRDSAPNNAVVPRVAILYLTCDDFRHRSVKTCVEVEYPAFRVFILDDSTEKAFQEQVDTFAQEHTGLVDVVRRGSRIGFKAANLNSAIKTYLCDYDYFVLVDADEELPPDFVAKAISTFTMDNSIAFVQAKHRCWAIQENSFTGYFSGIIDAIWEFYQGYRNRFGTVCCLGHGVVLQAEALRQVGAVPNIVSEDLALTMALAKLGRFGYFQDNLVALEGFPESLATYRKRFLRWTMADCECLAKCMWSFLTAKGVLWFEKLDILIREARMTVSSLFLPLVLIAWGAQSDAIINFGSNWHVMIVGLVAFCAPSVAVLLCPGHSIRARLRLVLLGLSVYMSFAVLSTLALVRFFLERRVEYVVTGRRSGKQGTWGANGLGTQSLEVSIGAILALAAIMQKDLILGGIGLALLLAPVCARISWHSWIAKLTGTIPGLLVMLGIIVAIIGPKDQNSQILYVVAMATMLFS